MVDLAQVPAWEPHNLHDLGQVFGVVSVLYASKRILHGIFSFSADSNLDDQYRDLLHVYTFSLSSPNKADTPARITDKFRIHTALPSPLQPAAAVRDASDPSSEYNSATNTL